MRPARILGDDGRAFIGCRTDGHLERHLSQERGADARRLGGRAAVTEDIVTAATVGADEVAHILDDAEYRHIHLAEHVQALAGIDQRQVLRCRDDHRAGQRRALREGQLGISGAGRHVDDQHVEIVPGDVAQHLLDRAHHHRAAPDGRRVLGDQIADRHGLQAPGLDRVDFLAVALRFPVLADQAGEGRPVDIGVENADPLAGGGDGQRQIDRCGRFADPALARGNGD